MDTPGYFSSMGLNPANEPAARAVRFVAPYRVEVAEVRVPEPGPGDVLVQAEFSGISGGTEMLAYRGEIDSALPLDETIGALAGTFAYPFAYGYSCVGRVQNAGALEGERVFAFHPHQDLFVVPEREALPLGAVGARVATLFPLVETALQVTLDAGVGMGDVVAVLGLGPVGILSAALMERTGAVVSASDPDPARREAAEAFGVAATSPGGLPDELQRASAGRGADLLVEASGDPAALAEGLELLAHEGTALVCSWYGTKPVSLPLGAAFHRRRLTIRSTQVSSTPRALQGRWSRERRRAEVLRLLEELPLKVLATHEFPFDQAYRAYAALGRGEPGLIHAALRYA
jgi:2-desacetyl-2-hydroxyethyl bacteriochlorophyllide A dehydrogenase